MYYIYQLSYNSIPFYIGMTIDPVKRYMQHCAGFGCTVRSFIINRVKTGEFPDLAINAHCEDKYEAKDTEKQMVNNLTSKGIFLVNSDYNSLDNVLVIRNFNLNLEWGYKLPQRYDTKVRLYYNEYIKLNNIKAKIYKIIPENAIVSDFIIARDIVKTYDLFQEQFVSPKVVGNFRKYLREHTRGTGKLFKTKTVNNQLMVIRIK